MLEEIKKQYPDFCEDKSPNYSLILTDDIDSLLSCKLQEYLFGRSIEYYVNFNEYYKTWDEEKIPCQRVYRIKDTTDNPVIGCDIALDEEAYTWDNHVCKISADDKVNTQSANLNSILNINRNNYYSKYCGSTLLQMASYYDIDLSKLSEEQLMVICAIDGLYTPFRVKYKDFRPRARYYLELMEYEFLGEFIQKQINKTNSYSEFYKIIDKYNLNGKIIRDEETRRLVTNIDLQGLSELFNYDLSLPDVEFGKYRKYKKYTVNLKEKYIKDKEGLFDANKQSLFNVALTNKDFIIYSTKSIIP